MSEFNKLLSIYKSIDKKYVLEIGSETGGTLRKWIANGRKGMKLFSIDLMYPRGSSDVSQLQFTGHKWLWKRLAENKGIEFHLFEKNSLNADQVNEIRSMVPYFDFVFIDGGHGYDIVKGDFYNYGKLVRCGGVVAFHDISGIHHPGVKRFWDEIKTGYRHEEFIYSSMGIGVLHIDQ
jgi:SAM-dependent methyltransferase